VEETDAVHVAHPAGAVDEEHLEDMREEAGPLAVGAAELADALIGVGRRDGASAAMGWT
jgi:hypothetical protein